MLSSWEKHTCPAALREPITCGQWLRNRGQGAAAHARELERKAVLKLRAGCPAKEA